MDIGPPKRNDIFHSNAFGRAASSGGVGVGAVDMISFRDRRHIERNRQNVQRYANSMIGMANTRESFRENLGASPTVRGGAMAARRQNLNMPQRSAFQEPPPRYNPYR